MMTSSRKTMSSSRTPPCTTNCLAPVVHVLHNAVGIAHGFMYDDPFLHRRPADPRYPPTRISNRARAAALNIIPTTTGAAKAVGLVIPDLNGKLDGASMRVPTPNVSLIDFKFVAKRNTTAEEVNSIIVEAANSNRLSGILNGDEGKAGLDGPQSRSVVLDRRPRSNQSH